MNNWDLKKIYDGYNSDKYIEDYNKTVGLVDKFLSFDFSKKKDINVFKEAFLLSTEIDDLFYNLFAYTQLRLSVNSEDTEALKAMGTIESLYISSSKASIALSSYVKEFDNLLEEAKKDEYFKKYPYVIKRMVEDSKRKLGDETEIMMSKLSRSGGNAWSSLFDALTSTLEVDYDDKTITLSEVRNLAYNSNQDIRKKAYEAEINSYKKIEKSIALALSSIKQEVTVKAQARGYKNGLDETLSDSGMKEETLKALISAIEDSYPKFRAYLKRKGELLGHKNGLPFYDLFAPMGKTDKVYTIKEAEDYLIDRFSTFNEEISSMMKKAFDNNWIDYLPYKGKVGGAFCEGVFSINESRILTNFDGSFNAVDTLAHELGHAFHNEVMWGKPLFLSNYPMQLAETASTFNEAFIMDDAIKNSESKEEKINLLEGMIQGDNQVIVDIMSRYYFESSVFEKSQDGALTANECCELMKEAQLKSYGDGLDKDYLHPYMWCCKGHYYSTGLSFYNFPYAFGQLFAYGLYSMYLDNKEDFFPLYKKILGNAGSMTIEECTMLAGIDVTKKSFWEKSLKIVTDRIDEFLQLTE